MSLSAHAAEIIVPGTGWHFNAEPPFVPDRIRDYPAAQAAMEGLSRQLLNNYSCYQPGLLGVYVVPSWDIYPLSGGVNVWCRYQNGDLPGNKQLFLLGWSGDNARP